MKLNETNYEEGILMAIDIMAKSILDQLQASGMPQLHQLTPEQIRQPSDMSATAGMPEEVAKVEDRVIPGPLGDIPVRIYTPEGQGPFPALIYFHGGGFVVGNLDMVDVPCRMLANQAECVVISVDYRLAPEYKFPAPLEDAYAAVTWIAEYGETISVDSARIAVGGDSAGGNLAAAISLMAKDKSGPDISFQLLIYPTLSNLFDTESYQAFEEGYLLSTRDLEWFWGHYLENDEDGQNPYASPILAEDLSGLPPALIIVAEYDQLRDEGEAYGQRLKEAGVSTEITRYDGMIHNFYLMPAVFPQGKEAIEQSAKALSRNFQQNEFKAKKHE